MDSFDRNVNLVVALIILVIVGLVVGSIWTRHSCKNGEDVVSTDGSMDCWGSDTYKHCEPATHFVCHDSEGN